MLRLRALLFFVLLTNWIFVTSTNGVDQAFTLCSRSCNCVTDQDAKKAVKCRDTNLTAIPNDLPPTTEILDFSEIPIRSLPAESFSSVGAVNLEIILLQRCKIEDLDKDAFNGLMKLKILRLDNNRIHTIHPETFRWTPSLEDLYMTANPIELLEDGVFTNLTNLRTVDFTRCQINRIGDRVFESVPRLEYLGLFGNRLPYLKVSTLKALPNNCTVELAGNTWKCDCHLMEFRNFYWKRFYDPDENEMPTCQKPNSLKGRDWEYFSPGVINCEP